MVLAIVTIERDISANRKVCRVPKGYKLLDFINWVTIRNSKNFLFEINSHSDFIILGQVDIEDLPK